ncbi:helix-turn-helix transcriptional regulator, partial [Pinirhizobacter sp.]|uniref:helix-turn-helix domain-containing protein n=1 Tax=Pinirhizobacter sp. TaxID=2950432 RepID=UPI002F40F15A
CLYIVYGWMYAKCMKNISDPPIFQTPRRVATEDLAEEVGARVRRQRVAFGWRQSELASRAGVSVQTIHAMENGRSISSDNFLRVLSALEHGVDVLKVLEQPHFPSMEAFDRFEALGQRSAGTAIRARVKP